MTLKDWKKKRNSYWNSKTMEMLSVRKGKSIWGDDIVYTVIIHDKTNWGKNLRDFKKKTDAIKYMKQYMKTH